MLWLITANRTSSTRIKAASSPARPSPARLPTMELRSAWTAKALGGTTCSSSVCGGASNTKRCICGPTTAFPMPAIPLDAIWTSTMVGAHTRALTALRPIRPTSRSCRSARQPKPGRRSTYRRGNSVQTIGATSVIDESSLPSVALILEGITALLQEVAQTFRAQLLASSLFIPSNESIEPQSQLEIEDVCTKIGEVI